MASRCFSAFPVLLIGCTLPLWPQTGSSGVDLKAIDKTANPCGDFFQYACGAWIRDNPTPSEREIREGIAGNFCRCTGYQHIVNAIQRASHAPRS